MASFKSFEADLSLVNESNFDNIALSLFRFQAKENLVYRDYLTHLGVNAQDIYSIDNVPFLPISFFKEHEVISGKWSPEATFLSSATTGTTQSRHLVFKLSSYLANARRIFESFYGSVANYHFFALLPSYLERSGSSLVAMVNYFISESHSTYSAFYLHDNESLLENLQRAIKSDKKVMLLGVTFALLDLAEKVEIDLSSCLVMETGGMKGRREEITREELHKILCHRFNLRNIHSEYGMTELLSQAYSTFGGYFKTPPWMKVMVRDINDPFQLLGANKIGGINVIDLANIYTCAFVETQDLGRLSQDGNFEVLGRIDNTDSRGCNLLVG